MSVRQSLRELKNMKKSAEAVLRFVIRKQEVRPFHLEGKLEVSSPLKQDGSLRTVMAVFDL